MYDMAGLMYVILDMLPCDVLYIFAKFYMLHADFNVYRLFQHSSVMC